MDGTRLPIETMGKLFVYYLLLPTPHQDLIRKELHLSDNTIVHWSQFIREAELQWCQENTPQTLGEPGTVVEVDDAKFGKRKYNRGRKLDGQWVFGGIQRGTTHIFLELVANRTQETLMEVISRSILPGTTILC